MAFNMENYGRKPATLVNIKVAVVDVYIYIYMYNMT